MTSTVRSTHLVDESEEKWKKGDPRETKTSSEKKTVISKNSSLKRFQIWYLSPAIIEILLILRFEYLSNLCVIVDCPTYNTIQLLKQTWFPPVRKDSQIEGSSAN